MKALNKRVQNVLKDASSLLNTPLAYASVRRKGVEC